MCKGVRKSKMTLSRFKGKPPSGDRGVPMASRRGQFCLRFSMRCAFCPCGLPLFQLRDCVNSGALLCTDGFCMSIESYPDKLLVGALGFDNALLLSIEDVIPRARMMQGWGRWGGWRGIGLFFDIILTYHTTKSGRKREKWRPVRKNGNKTQRILTTFFLKKIKNFFFYHFLKITSASGKTRSYNLFSCPLLKNRI